MTWYNFYKDRLNIKYLNHIKKRYNTYIGFILDLLEPNMLVVEAGCGMGNITRILSENVNNCNYVATDNDKLMLTLTRKNTNKDVKVHLHDLKNKFKDSDIDIMHSHGVLEHFDDKTICEIVSNQLKSCKILLHYVPSNKYKKPSFGDERLMSKKKWKALVNPDEIIEFNNGYDLILKWSNKKEL